MPECHIPTINIYLLATKKPTFCLCIWQWFVLQLQLNHWVRKPGLTVISKGSFVRLTQVLLGRLFLVVMQRFDLWFEMREH